MENGFANEVNCLVDKGKASGMGITESRPTIGLTGAYGSYRGSCSVGGSGFRKSCEERRSVKASGVPFQKVQSISG